MQKHFLPVIIILSMTIAAISQVFAQKSEAISGLNNPILKQTVKEQTGSYPIAGSDLLGYQYKEVADFLKANPGYFEKQRLMKTSAWGFTVGSQKVWQAINTQSNTTYSVSSTCKAVGTNCYIFVEDKSWGTYVDSNAVLTIENDFDKRTPANPSKGIFQTDVDTFGDPPNVDNDPKIIILILDIQDGFSGTGGYVAGYFSPSNEVGMNYAEIYFMDANPTNLKDTTAGGGLSVALSTAAHEFQHMINWNYHKTNREVTFVDEGLSTVAEIVSGYGASGQDLFTNEPNFPLFNWRNTDATLVLNDYARAQRFFLYLKEQFQVGILKDIVQDYQNYSQTGYNGINAVLQNKYSTSFGKVFINFEIANGLNNTAVNPAYGYIYQPIPVTTGTTFYNPNINTTSGLIKILAADYYTFINSSNLSVTFTPGGGSSIITKAIEIGPSSSRVVDVPTGTPFTEPAYPSTYNTIRFVALDTTIISNQQYQYQASGVASNAITELKWDSTEPTGYLQLSPGDSVAVQFNGAVGGKLDSIKVALRGIAPINGNIYAYAGLTNQMGGQKVGSFTATPTLTSPPAVVNSGGTYPYNIPYPNWVKVDLTSSNIDVSNSFVVEFPVGAAYPSTNRVMITDYLSSSPYHSYAYQSASPSTWTYYGIQGQTGYIYLFLIRAYVSFNVSGVKQEVELTPTSYSLAQNYPNPFNPSTKIDFTLPVSGNVRITVYNQLGQKVMLLTDGVYSAGAHELSFNAANLASGVYYYRIESGTFSQTKKMVLLK